MHINQYLLCKHSKCIPDVCLLTDLFDVFLCQWANKYTNWPHVATEHSNECFGSGSKQALCKLTFRLVTPVTIDTALYCDVALRSGTVKCTDVSEYPATFIIRGQVYHIGRSYPRKKAASVLRTEKTTRIVELCRLLSGKWNKQGSLVVCRVLVYRHSQLRIKMETQVCQQH